MTALIFLEDYVPQKTMTNQKQKTYARFQQTWMLTPQLWDAVKVVDMGCMGTNDMHQKSNNPSVV